MGQVMTAMPIIDADTARPMTPRLWEHARWQSLAWLALIVLVAVIVRAPYLGDPAADHDEQLYSVIGQGWLAGELPYRDMWDRKPPGLFLIFAAFHWIGGPGPWAFQIPGVIATAAAGIILYKLALRIGTQIGALTGTALFLLNIPLFLLHLGQSETYQLPLLLGSFALMLQSFELTKPRKVLQKLSLAMLLGGVALQIKYGILPICVMLGCFAIYRLYRMQWTWIAMAATALLFATLGLLPTLLFAVYFLANGAFWEFFDANFVSIFYRAPMPDDLASRFRIHMILAAFPLCVFAILGNFEARRRTELRTSNTRYSLLTFTVAGFASVLLLGQPYMHYFTPLLPFMCLLAVPFFSYSSSNKLFAAVAVGAAMVTASFDEQVMRTLTHRHSITALTQAIVTNTPEDECLFIFAGPTILYETTNRCIPSRLVYPDHFTNPRERNAMPLDPFEELERVLAKRPAAIVATQDREMTLALFDQEAVARVNQVLGTDYRLVQEELRYPRMVQVWVRNDL